MAAALDAAHEVGLVHRDVKPGNILVDATSNHVYLSDFGIVKVVAAETVTATGRFLGTAAYAAPEQIKAEAVDGRADVYALGCVAYQCLTGEKPFGGGDISSVLWGHLDQPPPRATALRPELDPQVDGIIAKAMAKRPDERYPTCGDLTGALAELAATAALAAKGPEAATDGGAAVGGVASETRHDLVSNGGGGPCGGVGLPSGFSCLTSPPGVSAFSALRLSADFGAARPELSGGGGAASWPGGRHRRRAAPGLRGALRPQRTRGPRFVGAGDPYISRCHGRLLCDGSGWWIRNEGRLPIRLPRSVLLLAGEEMPLNEGYSLLFIRCSSAVRPAGSTCWRSGSSERPPGRPRLVTRTGRCPARPGS